MNASFCGALFFMSRENLRMSFFVAVDSMNQTRIVGQGMVLNESTESYVFALESYVQMSGGRHPAVRKANIDTILSTGQQGPIEI